jgi:hypothetical protein
VLVVLEHQRAAAVLEEPRIAGGRLHDRAVGRDIALEDRGAAGGVDRLIDPADDLGPVDLGLLDHVFERGAGDVAAGEIEKGREAL